MDLSNLSEGFGKGCEGIDVVSKDFGWEGRTWLIVVLAVRTFCTDHKRCHVMYNSILLLIA
jgi:hypothetical protein